MYKNFSITYMGDSHGQRELDGDSIGNDWSNTYKVAREIVSHTLGLPTSSHPLWVEPTMQNDTIIGTYANRPFIITDLSLAPESKPSRKSQKGGAKTGRFSYVANAAYAVDVAAGFNEIAWPAPAAALQPAPPQQWVFQPGPAVFHDGVALNALNAEDAVEEEG